MVTGCENDRITDDGLPDDGSENTFTEIISDIIEDTTLSSNEIFTVTDNINLKAELTIEPGTIIKFKEGAGLSLSSEGSLIAELQRVLQMMKYYLQVLMLNLDDGTVFGLRILPMQRTNLIM